MGKPVLTEATTPQSPPARTTWKSQLHSTSRFSFKAGRETELPGSEANEPFRRASEEALSGAIDELQSARTVERENCHVDFFDHRAQESRSLQRAQALFAQSLAQRVYFEHHFAEGVVAARAPRADGKIFLAHCGEKLGQSLQREDNALPEGKREAQPKNNDEDRKRPGCLRRIVTKPQQEDRDQRSREARGQPQ